MKSEYVYIMGSDSWQDDTYKVGMSDDPERRAKELSSKTAMPYPVELLRFEQVDDMRAAEKAIHAQLKSLGLWERKEFFCGRLVDIEHVFNQVVGFMVPAQLPTAPLPALPERIETHSDVRMILRHNVMGLLSGQIPIEVSREAREVCGDMTRSISGDLNERAQVARDITDVS
jgi:predicted GIY-YIG superfamily endonuclease